MNPSASAPAARAATTGASRSNKRPREGEEEAPSPSPTPSQDQQQQRRRPRRRMERTLAVLLQSLEGGAVVVELKSDAEARGVLQEADDQMNMVLEGNVEYVTAKGGVQRLEAMYVKGKMVRYVHISPRVNVGKSIQRHLDSLDINARRFQRARLKPQARAPSPTLSSPSSLLASDGTGRGGGGSVGVPPRVIQVALPRPSPDTVLPGEH